MKKTAATLLTAAIAFGAVFAVTAGASAADQRRQQQRDDSARVLQQRNLDTSNRPGWRPGYRPGEMYPSQGCDPRYGNVCNRNQGVNQNRTR